MNTELMKKIHEQITSDPESLNMGYYLTRRASGCGTAHCIAGWAKVLGKGLGTRWGFYGGCDALEIPHALGTVLFYCEDDQAADALQLLIDNPDLDTDVLIDKLRDITTSFLVA